jgi:hypothetical protein
MSEKILRALMQLFAILANAETGEGVKGIEVVRSFLNELLSLELVEQYLGIYTGIIWKIFRRFPKKKMGQAKDYLLVR